MRDIAAEGNAIYDVITRTSWMSGVHNTLLEKFKSSEGKELLILGPGPICSPYNRIPKYFSQWKTTILDYNEENLNNADNRIKHDLNDSIDGFGKFDFIDASYTLHHLPYKQILQDRINEIYSLLNDDGIFHIGTGFCDMSWSETKIRNIGKMLFNSELIPVSILDERNDTHYTLKFTNNMEIIRGKQKADIRIDKNGIIYFPLSFKKRINMDFCESKHISTFLINPNHRADYENLVEPVNKFYYSTLLEIANVDADQGLIEKAVNAGNNERQHAQRGLIEYYQSEETWRELLKDFKIEIKHHPYSMANIFCSKV